MGLISLELILLFFATELKLPGDRQVDRNHIGVNRSCLGGEPLSTCGLNQIDSQESSPGPQFEASIPTPELRTLISQVRYLVVVLTMGGLEDGRGQAREAADLRPFWSSTSMPLGYQALWNSVSSFISAAPWSPPLSCPPHPPPLWSSCLDWYSSLLSRLPASSLVPLDLCPLAPFHVNI